tara:strand:+ start:255 stop:422 length:168 start_codon:yes stop_codon:yes gene_type:complete
MNNKTSSAQIKVKASPSDKKRWQEASEKDGRTLSDVIRVYLDRYAARVERKDALK